MKPKFLSLFGLILIGVSLTADEATAPARLSVTVGNSIVLDTPAPIQRVAVASETMVGIVAVNKKELLINGLAAGATSMIVWQEGGARTAYVLEVKATISALDSLRAELAEEFPGENVTASMENGSVFLRGRAHDVTTAKRAAAIAETAGKIVNLLYVDVPPAETQILLKVRFVDVDRSASKQLGANIISTGAGKTIGAASTGQYAAPTINTQSNPMSFTLSQALNLFLFRPDLNLGATIEALQNQSLLEILAEPNVMATDGKPASFVAGGEFPFPTVQGGANAGAVTISFREFGIRINFLPTVTPRGSILLHVTPEVSSLDFANGLVFQGYTIPAISTRRVDTQVELQDGQSFAVAGLLDNQVTKSLSKIPGISQIPVLGKLFQSMQTSKNNTELLIIVTPELVRAVPAGQAIPGIDIPEQFLANAPKDAPRTPGTAVTGPATAAPVKETLPLERLEELQAAELKNATASGASK